jgi:hypothetical protein
MIEFDIGAFLIGLGVGILIAMKLVHMIARNLIKKLSQGLDQEIDFKKETVQGKEVLEAVITKEKDTFYLFEKENDRFLAQGKTLEELHTALSARFKNVVVKVDAIPEELKQKTT